MSEKINTTNTNPNNTEIIQNPPQTDNLKQIKPNHFDVLSEENITEFMERRIQEFSNRYAELYSDKLGVTKFELSQSVQQKIKSNYVKVTIENVITGEEDVKLDEDGNLVHSKKSDPLTAAAYYNNRTTGEGEFKFKSYADQNDILNTKTIYHEFLHALGGTMRPGYNGTDEFSSGVQFDFNSRYINHYQPFEEGFTEIIAAEMVEIEPQSYTYEVPVCVLMRKIIGDKYFLQTKNGDLNPLLSEFPYEKLEELRNTLWVYQNGMKERLANIKYINQENRSIEIQSTETIVNDYVANESYISASKKLTSFFIKYFDDKIGDIKTQEDANDLFQILVNCQTTEQDILPPGNYYESSIPAINQALVHTQASLVEYYKNNNLQIPDKFSEFIPNYTQDRKEVTLNISVSDLQLKLLNQEIDNTEQKTNLSKIDSVLLMGKKWVHASIETQKKYEELFPGYLNRQFAYIKQLEAIQQIDPSFKSKYTFSQEINIVNVPDYTFITNGNISFTKGGYHASLPDYGFLIAKSFNTELLKKIFGDYTVPTFRLGIESSVLTEVEFEKAKGYLKEIKQIIANDESSVMRDRKILSKKEDGLPLNSDTINSIKQLKDLKISDFLQLRI